MDRKGGGGRDPQHRHHHGQRQQRVEQRQNAARLSGGLIGELPLRADDHAGDTAQRGSDLGERGSAIGIRSQLDEHLLDLGLGEQLVELGQRQREA